MCSVYTRNIPGPYSSTLSDAHAFNLALKDFKEIEQSQDIQEALVVLEESFSQELRLRHPRDIYPIYEALNFITNEIAKKSLNKLSDSWRRVLESLHNRKVYRIGLGPIPFDTSIAQEILGSQLDVLQKSIAIALIDLKDKHNQQNVIDYLLKADGEAFGACFQRGFLKELLKSDRVRCLIARDKKNEIVGILWGFLTDCENHQLFHFWELSRKASMAHMGIAKKLIECAKQQKHLYPNLEFATLNVDISNSHAKEIYDKQDFVAVNEAESSIKIFMENRLNSNSSAQLKFENTKAIVKKFVLNTIPLYKLIYYELARKCELIWRSCWYR